MDCIVESLIDRYDRMINSFKKIDQAQNFMYVLTIQFVDRMEKNSKINSEEKHRLMDQIET